MATMVSDTDPLSVRYGGRLFISEDEFAKALGCHKLSVRNWRQEGLISSLKLGGSRLYPLSELRRLLDEATGNGRSNPLSDVATLWAEAEGDS